MMPWCISGPPRSCMHPLRYANSLRTTSRMCGKVSEFEASTRVGSPCYTSRLSRIASFGHGWSLMLCSALQPHKKEASNDEICEHPSSCCLDHRSFGLGSVPGRGSRVSSVVEILSCWSAAVLAGEGLLGTALGLEFFAARTRMGAERELPGLFAFALVSSVERGWRSVCSSGRPSSRYEFPVPKRRWQECSRALRHWQLAVSVCHLVAFREIDGECVVANTKQV